MTTTNTPVLRSLFALVLTLSIAACAAPSSQPRAHHTPAADAAPDPSDASEGPTPPARIREWMKRLTVAHAWDPETGFIVARETISLPPMLADAPPLDEALRHAEAEGRIVIAFATADRCAPCQQYKKDALNDPRVVARLADARLLPTHVEVDRRPDLADRHLGGRAIPMTYAIDPATGARIATLPGQRTPEELLAWLDETLSM